MYFFGFVSIFFIIGYFIDIIGAILHIIGIATTNWSVATTSGTDFTNGVFRYCIGFTCYYNKDAKADVIAVEALTISGIVLAFIAAIAGIIHIMLGVTRRKPMKVFPLVTSICSMAAFIVIILGIIVWGASVHGELPSNWDLGYSFALSIVGGILLLAGGVLCLFGNLTFVDTLRK